MGTKGKPARILIVSGIFPPDIGGPAIHAARIAEYFAAHGWQVTVVAFGEPEQSSSYVLHRISRHLPKLISWACYAGRVLWESARHDVIYAFDLTTSGLPCALVSRIVGKPFVIRVGGDPVWERVAEEGKRSMPMRAYYAAGFARVDKPLLFSTARFVLLSADVVITYSQFLRDILIHHYGVEEGKLSIVENPLPAQRNSTLEQGTFTFLYAGRFVSYKNLIRVVRSFLSIASRYPHARLQLIGTGPQEAEIRRLAADSSQIVFLAPVSHEELVRYIQSASVALAPALTEFNPNFALESLALGKPVLLSRDSGISSVVPIEQQFDPLSGEELVRAFEHLLDPAHYQDALRATTFLRKGGSWEQTLAAHVSLVSSLL